MMLEKSCSVRMCWVGRRGKVRSGSRKVRDVESSEICTGKLAGCGKRAVPRVHLVVEERADIHFSSLLQ